MCRSVKVTHLPSCCTRIHTSLAFPQPPRFENVRIVMVGRVSNTCGARYVSAEQVVGRIQLKRPVLDGVLFFDHVEVRFCISAPGINRPLL